MASEDPQPTAEELAMLNAAEQSEQAALAQAVELHLRQRVVQLNYSLRQREDEVGILRLENENLRQQLAEEKAKRKTTTPRKRAGS